MNGLIISVYKDANGYDCTNGGISSFHANLTLIGTGIEGPFAPTEERPAVTMVTRTIGERKYTNLVPCDENAQPLPGWYMAGGNYGYTSDSRFRILCPYPLPIHDRKEGA